MESDRQATSAVRGHTKPGDRIPQGDPIEDALRNALAELRRATEMALGYPDARITRAQARALLNHIQTLERGQSRLRLLENARDEWYAKDRRQVGELRTLRRDLREAQRD